MSNIFRELNSKKRKQILKKTRTVLLLWDNFFFIIIYLYISKNIGENIMQEKVDLLLNTNFSTFIFLNRKNTQ